MSEQYATIEGRRVSHSLINAECKRLLDEDYFSCEDQYQMGRLLKFLCQRRLGHKITFDPGSSHYFASVELPLNPPMTITVSAKTMPVAVALCGLRLAELANL